MNMYIMVWIDEEEKWYYYKNEADFNKFKNGYVDYYIEVENGAITKDTYCINNIGKEFTKCYNAELWNKEKSCPNCGREIKVELTVHKDVLGDYCICPYCKSSANKEMYLE